MSFFESFALPRSGLASPRTLRLAQQSCAKEQERFTAGLREDEALFRAASDARQRAPSVLLGTTKTGVPYRIGVQELTSLPWWLCGATGSGKSRFVGGIVAQLLEHMLDGAKIAVVVIDGKGETADQALRTLAARTQHLTLSSREALLDRIHTLRVFDKDWLPSWGILRRSTGLPILIHADILSEVLIENAADASVGPRQKLMLSRLLALALEKNIELVELPWLLNSPAEVAALAQQSATPVVRLDLSRFDREPQGSIDGLVARLGVFLNVPSFKAALSAERTFDFAKAFDPGNVTVIDLAAAGLSARGGIRALGSFAISGLTNAALDMRRRVRGTTLIVVDEPQAFLNSVSLSCFDRIVTQGRSFGAAGIGFIHQGSSQLPVEFQTILNTNIPLRILGRSSQRDAEAAAEWLPRTGRVRAPRNPDGRRSDAQFLSESQELRHRVAELGHLPSRHFLVADRLSNFAPRVVVAPTFEPPEWNAIDPELAAAIRRGSQGVPRADLERRVAQIEEAADARFQQRRQGEGSTGRRRSRAVETPDIVGNCERHANGEIP